MSPNSINYFSVSEMEEEFDLEEYSKEDLDLLETEILRKVGSEEKELNFN